MLVTVIVQDKFGTNVVYRDLYTNLIQRDNRKFMCPDSKILQSARRWQCETVGFRIRWRVGRRVPINAGPTLQYIHRHDAG